MNGVSGYDPKIQVRVPPEIKRKYKVLCTSEGTNMQDDLNAYIKRRLGEENETKST